MNQFRSLSTSSPQESLKFLQDFLVKTSKSWTPQDFQNQASECLRILNSHLSTSPHQLEHIVTVGKVSLLFLPHLPLADHETLFSLFFPRILEWFQRSCTASKSTLDQKLSAPHPISAPDALNTLLSHQVECANFLDESFTASLQPQKFLSPSACLPLLQFCCESFQYCSHILPKLEAAPTQDFLTAANAASRLYKLSFSLFQKFLDHFSESITSQSLFSPSHRHILPNPPALISSITHLLLQIASHQTSDILLLNTAWKHLSKILTHPACKPSLEIPYDDVVISLCFLLHANLESFLKTRGIHQEEEASAKNPVENLAKISKFFLSMLFNIVKKSDAILHASLPFFFHLLLKIQSLFIFSPHPTSLPEAPSTSPFKEYQTCLLQSMERISLLLAKANQNLIRVIFKYPAWEPSKSSHPKFLPSFEDFSASPPHQNLFPPSDSPILSGLKTKYTFLCLAHQSTNKSAPPESCPVFAPSKAFQKSVLFHALHQLSHPPLNPLFFQSGIVEMSPIMLPYRCFYGFLLACLCGHFRSLQKNDFAPAEKVLFYFLTSSPSFIAQLLASDTLSCIHRMASPSLQRSHALLLAQLLQKSSPSNHLSFLLLSSVLTRLFSIADPPLKTHIIASLPLNSHLASHFWAIHLLQSKSTTPPQIRSQLQARAESILQDLCQPSPHPCLASSLTCLSVIFALVSSANQQSLQTSPSNIHVSKDLLQNLIQFTLNRIQELTQKNTAADPSSHQLSLSLLIIATLLPQFSPADLAQIVPSLPLLCNSLPLNLYHSLSLLVAAFGKLEFTAKGLEEKSIGAVNSILSTGFVSADWMKVHHAFVSFTDFVRYTPHTKWVEKLLPASLKQDLVNFVSRIPFRNLELLPNHDSLLLFLKNQCTSFSLPSSPRKRPKIHPQPENILHRCLENIQAEIHSIESHQLKTKQKFSAQVLNKIKYFSDLFQNIIQQQQSIK
eukprot:Sdes_comp15333_c0_seq1m4190